MAAMFYQHWIGEMVVEAHDFPAGKHAVDEWFPAKPGAGAATLVATDEYPEATDLFEDVITIRGKVGPIKIRLGVDLAFVGKVEYWKAGGS